VVAAVAGVCADGGTNIHGVLLSTMEWLAPSDRPQYVIFLTDVLPTAGSTDTATGTVPVMAVRSTQKLAEAELAEELATVREVEGGFSPHRRCLDREHL